MKYYIQKAMKEDLLSILELQKEAFYRVAEAENNFNIKPMIQTYEEIVEEFENKIFLKCVIDDRIVGSIRAVIDENNTCHIGRVVVKPTFQKNGIGFELMKAVEKECNLVSAFCLFTSKLSESTIRLYKKLGYTITGELGDADAVMVIMEKNNDSVEKNKIAVDEVTHAHTHGHTHEYNHEHIHEHKHVHSAEEKKAIVNRLSRAIGHMEAVKRMVENDTDCSEVLIQLAAVRSAINNTGKVVLKNHINHCIVEAIEEEDHQAIHQLSDAIDKFMK